MGDILLLLMSVQAQILTDLDKLNKEYASFPMHIGNEAFLHYHSNDNKTPVPWLCTLVLINFVHPPILPFATGEG